FVSLCCRRRDPARQLFHVERSLLCHIQTVEFLLAAQAGFRQIAETRRWLISNLFFTSSKIDRLSVDSTRCSCLESGHGKTKLAQMITQSGRAVCHSPSTLAAVANM